MIVLAVMMMMVMSIMTMTDDDYGMITGSLICSYDVNGNEKVRSPIEITRILLTSIAINPTRTPSVLSVTSSRFPTFFIDIRVS